MCIRDSIYTDAKHEWIRRMVDERTPVTEDKTLRPCTYGDFAILLRSNKAVTPRYRAALAEQGIPSVSQQGGGFFRSTEITSLLALLGVIDNPHQDVPLIAVLRSPLFGFTPDRLAELRAKTPGGDFYDALAADGGEDSARFLALLRELRSLLTGTGEYSLDFGDGTTQQGYIVLRPVSMTYRTSTYEQSRAIIDRLSASDNINRISDLSIRRDERSGGGQGYQTVLTVTYFEVAP